MIGTIRKHSKVLWWVVIVAIIITFVWWGSSSSRTDGGASSDGNYGVMNGETISPTLFNETAQEIRLNYFYASNGRWPGQGQPLQGYDPDRETFQRILLVKKIAEFGIHVSEDAVAQAANARMRAVNRGNPVSLAEFEKLVLNPAKVTIADFERFIRHELAIQQLFATISAGGDLITPAEVEKLYRREFQEISAQAAFFRATNDLSSIVVTPEKLGQFYTNRQSYYRVPERAQFDYVSFPLSNFLAAARQELDKNTNLTEIIEARYEQLGTNYFSDVKTPEEAKQRIRTEFEKEMAMYKAGQDAKKFNLALYEMVANNEKAAKVPAYSTEVFSAVAKELGLTAQISAPFSLNETPAGLDVSEDFVRLAFNLSAEEPLADTLVGENHVYIIGFNRRLPSEVPPFDAIRERVTQDYRFIEAAIKAYQSGVEFHATATNGLSAGQTFASLCAKAGVKPVTLAPFSPSTRTIPEIEKLVDPQSFRQAAFTTEPGQVGPVLEGSDGAVVLFVQARLPIDEAAMRTNLPSFTRNVQQMRRSEVFNEWFRVEATKAFATIPYFQKQQSQMSGAAAGK